MLCYIIGMTEVQWRESRKVILSTILATDMVCMYTYILLYYYVDYNGVLVYILYYYIICNYTYLYILYFIHYTYKGLSLRADHPSPTVPRSEWSRHSLIQ